jgi:hypothetical protein
MTDDQWFEIRARAFQQMRGMVAPGMEAENTPDLPDAASRKAAWLVWNAVHSYHLNAIRDAMEQEERLAAEPEPDLACFRDEDPAL